MSVILIKLLSMSTIVTLCLDTANNHGGVANMPLWWQIAQGSVLCIIGISLIFDILKVLKGKNAYNPMADCVNDRAFIVVEYTPSNGEEENSYERIKIKEWVEKNGGRYVNSTTVTHPDKTTVFLMFSVPSKDKEKVFSTAKLEEFFDESVRSKKEEESNA